MGSAKIVLKPGREKSLLRCHPWVFSGAVAKEIDIDQNGQTVEVLNSNNQFLAWGAFSEKSQIRCRLLSFHADDEIDNEFIGQKIKNAIYRRIKLFPKDKITNAYRLVYSEADELPGLIVDKYADILVCQFLSMGAEIWKRKIVQHLNETLSPLCIYERSDSSSRKKEGLPKVTGILSGILPTQPIKIIENGVSFLVDVEKGHKTGFYLDQKSNRNLVREYCMGKDVLNCFGYTGGFSINAALGKAKSVIHVDSSKLAIDLAKQNQKLNKLENVIDYLEGDCFKHLRKFADEKKLFDVIILDPPKFIENAKQIHSGARGYKDINLWAFKILKPGGFLFTFSCSGHLSKDLFQKIVSDAAVDAQKDVLIHEYLIQEKDHPIPLSFPEALYLKGLACQVK